MNWEEAAQTLFPEDFNDFQSEVGKGRRPDAVIFTNAEEDVKRRDFTINGLLYDLDTNEIVDYVGGQSDLQFKVLRTIGNAKDRFDEDPLRKLRALRFAHRLEMTIDHEIFDALSEDPSLEGVSDERIFDELQKAFKKAKSPANLAHQMRIFGFDQVIFNKAFVLRGEMPNSFSIVLSKLFLHLSGKEVHNMLKLRKFPTHVCERVEFLINLRKFKPENVQALKRRQNALRISETFLTKFLDSFVIFDITDEEEQAFIKALKVFIDFKLDIKAEDVIQLGFKGKEITNQIVELEAERFRRLIA